MDNKQIIASELAKVIDSLDQDAILNLLEQPKSSDLGDIAFPAFSLAKVERKAPQAIATDLAEKIDTTHFEKVVANVLDYYENYQFNSITSELRNFFNVELSSFYLDYGKDILYIEGEDSSKRRSMLTVLYTILSKSVRLFAPILSFTAEEIYDNMPYEDAESVHLLDFPEKNVIEDAALEAKCESTRRSALASKIVISAGPFSAR